MTDNYYHVYHSTTNSSPSPDLTIPKNNHKHLRSPHKSVTISEQRKKKDGKGKSIFLIKNTQQEIKPIKP